jgi:hypothetical protein
MILHFRRKEEIREDNAFLRDFRYHSVVKGVCARTTVALLYFSLQKRERTLTTHNSEEHHTKKVIMIVL